MRTNIRLYILVCMLLCFASCNHKPYPQSLIIADSLASAHPDSAIALLKNLREEMSHAPEATQMYYRLLCIKADDKAYIEHTSDSAILPILHYYIEKNDERHLPEAYYYAGRIYRDLGDAPQALEYFRKAMETLPEGGGNKLKSKIYSQIGTLLLYQNLYDEALEIFKKKYVCNIESKDSIGMVYTLRDMADAYYNINKADSALYYHQAAYNLSRKLQRQDLINMMQSQIASLYLYQKKYTLAKAILQNALEDIKHPNKSAIYSIASELYYKMGMTDSATYYYTELLNFGTIYAKEAAHYNLAEIAIKEGNNHLAIQHLLATLACADSIRKLTYTESINKMLSLFNYQLREKENNRLKTENQKITQYIFYSLAAFIIAVAFFFAYRQYSKRKRQQLNYQLQKVKQMKEDNYRKSQKFIDDNNNRIRALEQELDNVASINESLRKELQEQKEWLYHETRQAEIEQNKREQAKKALPGSDIYKLLKERLLDPKGNVFVTTDEWGSIESILDSTYKNFFKQLNDIRHFNEYELHVCMLIKLGFSPSEIAKLLEHPKETITSTRRRLYYYIFGTKGKPEDWDSFIISL